MTLRGHVQNGVIVLDDHVRLPEGAQVRIETVSTPTEPAQPKKRREGGQLKGQIHIADDFDELPDDLREAFGMNEP